MQIAVLKTISFFQQLRAQKLKNKFQQYLYKQQ
jgi:hypothetical protein